MFEERIEKAVEFFKSGYNCSQSVVLAFADMYGFCLLYTSPSPRDTR